MTERVFETVLKVIKKFEKLRAERPKERFNKLRLKKMRTVQATMVKWLGERSWQSVKEKYVLYHYIMALLYDI